MFGIQDKNGEDVFVGDVFKNEWGDYYIATQGQTGYHICRKGATGKYNKLSTWNNAKNHSKIGNIYESEELREELHLDWI